MKANLAGKVALVTGSSRGIGRAIAGILGETGVRLVINGRDPARLDRTAEQLRSLGCEVLPLTADVADPALAKGLIQETVSHYGQLDILINNAGVAMRGDFADLDLSVIDDVVSINLLAPAYLTHYALPHLVASKGHVVFISSLVAFRGLPHLSVYCASKMALTGLAQSLRAENRRRDLHVGILYVGMTEIDSEKTVLAADGSQMALNRPSPHSSQRDVAKAVLGLLRRRRFARVMTAVGHIQRIAERLSPRLVAAIANTLPHLSKQLHR